MVESETLQFDNARTLQNLYANDFKLLQALEEKLAVKVTARDGWLRVEGERPNIEKTRKVFDQLEEARQHGIIEQRVEDSVGIGGSRLRPVRRGKQQWYASIGEGIGKCLPALQSLFELSKREARIDSQKCTFGIGSLQRGILTATCSKAVAQNSEQRFSLFASGNTNHAFRAGQLHQFPCLSYIALHQKQKLGRPSRSVFVTGATDDR